MIGASLCFTIANAITKFEVSHYPVGEILFGRSLTSFIVAAMFILPAQGASVFKTRIPAAHVARGMSQAVSQSFTVLALALMPLTNTVAINFSAPLWAALVSVLWLRERPGPMRLAFVATGFVGVLVVAMPDRSALQLGSLFALANAIMYGSVTVAVRRMTKTESWQSLMIWQLGTIAAAHATLLVFGCRPMNALDLLLLIGAGIANAGGQFLWTRALQLAPATAVSPFYYTMLVWSLLLGFVVWGDIPTIGLITGSMIVVISGLMLLWHEARSPSEAKGDTTDAAPATARG